MGTDTAQGSGEGNTSGDTKLFGGTQLGPRERNTSNEPTPRASGAAPEGDLGDQIRRMANTSNRGEHRAITYRVSSDFSGPCRCTHMGCMHSRTDQEPKEGKGLVRLRVTIGRGTKVSVDGNTDEE